MQVLRMNPIQIKTEISSLLKKRKKKKEFRSSNIRITYESNTNIKLKTMEKSLCPR